VASASLQWLEYFNIKPALSRLLKFSLITMYLVHVFGCAWYYTCQIDNFSPQTWVMAKGVWDKPAFE
jgi:hypothetical protein